MKVRRFDTLLDALAEGRGDVVVAAIPTTAALRQRFTTTRPYFRTPARFAVRRDRNAPEPDHKALEGRTVAVVAGTAHEAYLKTFFSSATAKPLADLAAVQAALRDGDFATYGEEIAKVEAALQRLNELAPELGLPSPGASASPAP